MEKGHCVELKLLGTAAAEGYPAIACSCRNCTVARELGGRDIRKRSHAIVDNALLIDPGPDLLSSVHQYGLELHRLSYVLLTHGHSDHLLLSNLQFRAPAFAPDGLAQWELCGSERSLAAIAAIPEFTDLRLTLRSVRVFETFSLGDYTVTALRARHDEAFEPLLYVIRRGDAALLYATDSGPWFLETWDALAALRDDGVRLGAAIVEATSGVYARPDDAPPGGHMTFSDLVWHMRELRARGISRENATLIAHHFSHNGVPPYTETAAILAPDGIIPAFDGMTIQV